MTKRDVPGVIALPPLLYAGALLLVVILERLMPWSLYAHLARVWIGAALTVAGIAVVLWGSATMHRAGTNVPPNRPATALVTQGPFRYTRNPLYLGLHATFLGLTYLLQSAWGLLVFVPLAVVMHHGVILREEAYLERKFGDAYRAYCKSVRRYF